jgi:hypothetical protein
VPAIRLTAFRGEQPVLIPRLLPDTGAKNAVDVRLDDGGLTPTKARVQVDTVTAGHQTIYRHGGDWRSWADVVHAAPGPVATDRLYFTGSGVPKMASGGTDYDLKLAAPAGALTASLGGVGAGDVTTRLYVYTWVTGFGEESEPCPASNEVNWQPGNTVLLTGFVNAPAGRNITKQRIYRSQTGQSAGTYFYLIAERAASNSNFTDNIAVTAFQEALPSADWTPPSDDLKGLVSMQNGMMAAFVGRELCFCEPYRPHAWPDKYKLLMDSDIVGLGAIGSSLVVVTKGQPHILTGGHPGSMQGLRLEENRPCINGRGIVNLGFVIAYPSTDGLCVVAANGEVRLATQTLFNRDKWLELDPATFVAAQHSGRYVAFYDTTDSQGAPIAGAIIIDVGAPFLIRTAERAIAAHFDLESSGLYLLRPSDNNVYRYDAPDGARKTLYWRSKEFILSQPTSLGAIKVDADSFSAEDIAAQNAARAAVIAANQALIGAGPGGGEFNGSPIHTYTLNGDNLGDVPPLDADICDCGVYADGVLIHRISVANRAERLPSGVLANRWEVDILANVTVSQIAVAKTMDELKQIPT